MQWNLCPAAILSGSCLGGKNCIKDSDCLSGVCDKNKCTQSTGYNSDGIFTATVATFSLLSSTHDTNPMPEISVTNEIGLTTEMCSDSDCLIVIGEVEHSAATMSLTPDLKYKWNSQFLL